jgi:hypothetical protein
MIKYLGNDFHMLPAPPPKDHFAELLRETVYFWGTGLPPGHTDPSRVTGEARVRAALETLDVALRALGKKTGTRADAARAWLESRRAEIGAALTAFESIGVNFDGPAARDIINRITRARAATAGAEFNLERAVGAAVRPARDALDLVEADGRALGREIIALRDAATLPELPNLDAFENAKSGTADLVFRIRHGKRPTTTLQIALEQGASASDEVARLWIVFEPSTDHDAFKLRAARFAEGRDEIPAEREREAQRERDAITHREREEATAAVAATLSADESAREEAKASRAREREAIRAHDLRKHVS